uniref:Putative secreted protein n=1 Tax=Ixodes ricinus TaxID=34613 RepID=A0A0K8RJ60_IXORI
MSLNSSITRSAQRDMRSSARLSLGFSKLCASEKRWKALPSTRTTSQQFGRHLSSCSNCRTYSNLLLAIFGTCGQVASLTASKFRAEYRGFDVLLIRTQTCVRIVCVKTLCENAQRFVQNVQNNPIGHAKHCSNAAAAAVANLLKFAVPRN